MSETLQLSSIMDLLAAEGLKDRVVSILDAEEALVIDASEVSRITTPCVQIIIAASKELQTNDNDLKLVASSSVFDDAMRDLGFESFLNNWRASDE